MKIATWNVNSIKARLPLALEWLQAVQPEVVLLQETKTVDETFPREAFEDLYYNVATVGQKTYNGVAILSKKPLEDICTQLPGDEADTEARYIEAVVGDVRVASIYVPNGQEVGAEKYYCKLKFLERLERHVQELLTYEEAFVLGGDYNIAPQDADVYNPKTWEGKILCSLEERSALRKLLNLGLTDAIRIYHPEESTSGKALYSWWNYRTRAWDSNSGLRIDHLFVSPQAADRLQGAGIDTGPRAKAKASDHAPVWCTLGD